MILKGYSYLFLTAISWSVAGILIRFNSQSGLMIAVVSSIVAVIFNRLFNYKKIVFNKLIICIAICQFISGITFNYANQLTTVGNAMFYNILLWLLYLFINV